ncbi:hypothetical protein [Aeromonas molluscorum]|uniref:hypothetical protein n=1 Tax=Aeromonas molluscorum TaxID=271417 RepID=UPI003F1DFF09
MLALLASLLFTLSFTLFQYASWWPVLTEDPTLAWGGVFQGRTFAELVMPMLAFGAFWPLFLLTPRLLLPPLFAVLWLWQTYETATASTWQPLEILYAFVLPHVHWLLVTLGPTLWLAWSLGRSLLVPAADGR